MVRYSICMTCFNEAENVKESMSSLLEQLDESYEVVVVDNFSTDGTFEALKEFERSHRIKVIQKRSSRGQGREFAFEFASGDYIIANLDLDDTFLPVLGEIMNSYHKKTEGKLLAVFNSPPPPDMDYGWVQNITIGPNELVKSLGGWRDLNIFEDWDLWSRAERAQKYCWTSYKFARNVTVHQEPKSAYKRLVERYKKYRIRLLLGLKIFSRGEKIGLSQRLAYIAARTSLLFRDVLEGQDPEFNSLNLDFFVSLSSDGGVAK